MQSMHTVVFPVLAGERNEYIHEKTEDTSMQYDVYMWESAYASALSHARESAAHNLESMGLLVGSAHRYNGRSFVIITHYLTAQNASTAVSVRFSEQAFRPLVKEFASRLQENQLLVGWLHSHPSYGCFLSATDVKTQQTYFGEAFNVAFVVDPLQRDADGEPHLRAYRLDSTTSKGYAELSYAVIRKRKGT